MPRKISKEPSLLAYVIKAITKLRDDNGSTASRIISCVQALLKNSDVKVTRNKLASHVEKAIQDGVDTGLLKLKPGRYLLSSQCTVDVNSKKSAKNDVHHKKQPAGPAASSTTNSVVSADSTDSMEETEKPNNKLRQRSRKRRRTSGAATPEPGIAEKHHSAKLSHGHAHKRKACARDLTSAIKSGVSSKEFV